MWPLNRNHNNLNKLNVSWIHSTSDVK